MKILLKTIVLVLIVFSVYFIVHPSACSNLLAGRETIAPVWAQEGGQPNYPLKEQSERLTPGNSQNKQPVTQAGAQNEAYDSLFETDHSASQQPVSAEYSQQDIDYAIASRYVELEREYTRAHKMGKDTSREIASIVMEDFEMSPAEWDGFISRATSTDLFNKVRRDLPASSEH